MTTKTILVHLLVVLMAAPPAMARARQEPSDTWRAFAGKLEAGAFVRVRMKDGSSTTGHFIQITGDALRVKPKTRIEVPIRTLPFEDIASIERRQEGWSPGAKVLLGVGIGFASLYAEALLVYTALGGD